MLVQRLRAAAVRRGLLAPQAEIDAAQAFQLVRDMPYIRARTRDPVTIIGEWRGTCSGKHYLLKGLLAELGYPSRLIACTTVTQIDPQRAFGRLRRLLEQSNGRFVDVHNYLILELAGGEMIVDATWPIGTQGMGTVVNERFVLGENQRIAAEPLQRWVVPEGGDAQAFKDRILRETFTPEELAHRDEVIRALGVLTNNPWVKLLVGLQRGWKRLTRRS